MPLIERRFPSAESAAEALADEIAATLRDAIEDRGQATLAVSGGRTPKRVFPRLRRAPLDWGRVTLTLTDERWVPPDHPESNEHLVRLTLLRGAVRDASFVPLYGGETTPQDGWAACERRLESIAWPLDAVYLGTAADGHIASLFPDDRAAEGAEGLCVPVHANGERIARMSLSWRAILSARRIYLFFTGPAKAAAYARAKQPGTRSSQPLRKLLACEAVPITVLSSP